MIEKLPSRDKSWEAETLELIQDQQEERQRLASRLAAIQQAIQRCDQLIQAYTLALEGYRAKYGLSTMDPPRLTDFDRATYEKAYPKDIINRWADAHGGVVVMRDLCQAMTTLDVYTDNAQAASTLYSTIRRMPEFQKSERGVYRRVPSPQR